MLSKYNVQPNLLPSFASEARNKSNIAHACKSCLVSHNKVNYTDENTLTLN